MEQGLVRFGEKDFGNADADRRFFPRDQETAQYLAAKARVLKAYPGCNAHVVLDAAAQWMSATLHKEGQPEIASLEPAVGAHIPETS